MPQNGLYELIANVPAIRKAVQNVFWNDPSPSERDQEIEDEGAVVHVAQRHGGPTPKTTNIADYLEPQGMDAIVPPVNGGRADRDGLRRHRHHGLQRRASGTCR